MSTNIDLTNPGDTEALEQLVNQFFKAPPGNGTPAPWAFTPAAFPQGPSDPDEPLGALGHPQAFDINDPQSSLPDPHFEDGKVPSSVAGSGDSLHSSRLAGTPLCSLFRVLQAAPGEVSLHAGNAMVVDRVQRAHLTYLPFSPPGF